MNGMVRLATKKKTKKLSS